MQVAEATGYRALLHNRPFRLLLLAYAINTFGNWITVVAALALATFKWHASPLELGGMVSVFLAPAAVAGPLSGWLADRLDRRCILVAANLIACVVVLAMPLAATIWQSYLILVVSRLVSSVNQPVMSAPVPSLVRAEDITRANGILLQPAHATRAVSPLVGGLIVGGLGASAAFMVDAATFLCAAALIGLLLAGAGETACSPASQAELHLVPGASSIALRGLIPLAMIALAASFSFGALDSVAPLYVRDLLNLDVGAFGAVVSAIGLGAMIGGLAPGIRPEADRPLLFGMLVAIGGFLIIAATQSFWTLLIGSWIAGFGSGVVLTSGQTLIHCSIARAHHATALGMMSAVVNVGALAGITIASLLVSAAGVTVTLWLLAALLTASLPAAPGKSRRIQASASFETTSPR